jgi:hypothetical protein
MSSKPEASEPVTITYPLDVSKLSDIEPVYANYIQLVFTASEVLLNFGRMDPPSIDLDDIDPNEPPTITVKPVVRIVLPHQQFRPLAELVERQYAAFVQAIGAPAEGNTEHTE